ncbi:hypothetical protein ASC77_01960 [Nocardioides sp. Root1257]|uniref:hypothetical protein n=1 Tax=unclassified Nocardioides TaxID=2615069 RepID=UPI0006F93182|nr:MULTISPECIES: hypothetical protein [unclassified Nocardioides]KQW53088.1 hypothetical protein ASC77_01960 [Nocardioides sp. Root1257]KRC55776.1 hypothetical protein ASE24_01960 [Nocardioides sp. Root224]
MTDRPSYVVHEVSEKDVTVEWFFGRGHVRTKVFQAVWVLVSWFFVVLPVFITASSLLHRDDEGGWWSYQEGFDMWDRTVFLLEILFLAFVLIFLGLHLLDRVSAQTRNSRREYDEQRLALRLEIAETWYSDKYGPQADRVLQRAVQIQPYGDIETYELRGLYRANGVD